MRLDEKIKKDLIKKGYGRKYCKPGIYSISIEDKLIYIGKSSNMLKRMASHLACIQTDKSHKYEILRQAQKQNLKIKFDVLYCAKTYSADELGQQEAILINKHQPQLNYQLPLLENYHKYKVNDKAKTITLSEIMGDEYFIFQ